MGHHHEILKIQSHRVLVFHRHQNREIDHHHLNLNFTTGVIHNLHKQRIGRVRFVSYLSKRVGEL